MKKLTVLIVVVAIAGVVGYAMYREGSLPVNKEDTSKQVFVVTQGAVMNDIINNLEKQDLIRSKLVFYVTVKRLGIERKIQAGAFSLSPSMNAQEIAEALTHGTLDKWITILEGWRKEEVAEAVSEEFDINKAAFLQQADEGYLFPDTYLVPTEAREERVIQILRSNFDTKITPELKNKIEKNGLTLDEAITLASLVEREARSAKVKQEVASILLKRLQNDWLLNIDATIQYASGYDSAEGTWWEKNITQDELEIDSPYNTYTNIGLPPGPICNPGLDSIEAVANADADTPYWFYITDNNGVMRYAKTLEEHNANVEKYLR